MLRLNAAKAMKLAFDGLKETEYKTRDTAIEYFGGFESVELSVLLCNDEFILKLNKEWRDEDHATDVLSTSQHIPEINLPFVSDKQMSFNFQLNLPFAIPPLFLSRKIVVVFTLNSCFEVIG